MQIIDPNETMIPMNIIKATNATAHGQLVASRDMNHEARSDSETTHAMFMTAHAHQVVLAFEMSFNVGVMKIHVLTYPYETCQVLDEVAQNIH